MRSDWPDFLLVTHSTHSTQFHHHQRRILVKSPEPRNPGNILDINRTHAEQTYGVTMRIYFCNYYSWRFQLWFWNYFIEYKWNENRGSTISEFSHITVKPKLPFGFGGEEEVDGRGHPCLYRYWIYLYKPREKGPSPGNLPVQYLFITWNCLPSEIY